MTSQVRNIAATGLLVASLVLTGCGSEKTVTTSDGSKVKVDADGDGATIKTDDGEISVGQGLPDGFPEDDIPVIDAKVIGGAKGTDGGPYAWSVVMQQDGDVGEIFDEAEKKLLAAGYTAGQGMDMNDVRTGQFTSDKYDVGVNVAKTGDAVTITYAVRLAGAE